MRIAQWLPAPVRTALKKRMFLRREQKDLQAIARIACEPSNLHRAPDLDLNAIFKSAEIDALWDRSKSKIEAIEIPDGTHGVNKGDRRAIYYLIAHLKPATVLEIGTHVGASTMHIAAALSAVSRGGPAARLTTVDIEDVNDAKKGPWVKFGLKRSPAQAVAETKGNVPVEFVTANSFDFFARNDQTFDFIFLDGDHSAKTVYREIPAALGRLNAGGVILLHDYYPRMKPIWSNGVVIPGPWLATERLKAENSQVEPVPLGSLPWPTKLGSNVTSLALMLRK